MTQVNVLKKIFFFGYLSKTIWFFVSLVTVKMFEFRNLKEKKRNFSQQFTEGI